MEHKKRLTLSISAYSVKKRNQLAFFLSSIIPLVFLSFLALSFLFPELGINSQNVIVSTGLLTIFLLLILSLSGYYLTIKDTEFLIERADAISRKLSRINEFALISILNPTADSKFMFNQILDVALNITDSDAGAILVPGDENMLNYVVTKGKEISALEGLVVPSDAGILGYCLNNRKAYYTNNLTTDSLFDMRSDRMGDLVINNTMVIPIIRDDRIAIIIQLANKKNSISYTDQDLNLLQNLVFQSSAFTKSTDKVSGRHDYLSEATGILSALLEANGLGVQHHERVAEFSDMIGEILLDNDMEKDDLHTAALLHDIGLVFIEPHLRTNVEIYQRHSSIGADLLKKVAPWRNASIIVQHHHENYNGTGYPEGLSGEDIPLPSKILAVGEYYDYLINNSFESQSLEPEEAKFEIINCSGTYFDPKVVEVFAQVFDHINKTEK